MLLTTTLAYEEWWSMSTLPRKRPKKAPYHHGDLHTSILQAAGKLVEEQGVASLSLREVARRAGVSHNAPYRHFADRDALLAALAAEGYARLNDVLEAAEVPRARGEAYVRFALENPQRFRLMFGGLLRIDADPGLRAAAARTYDGLVRAFEPLVGPRGAPSAAAAAWSLVHGLAQLLLDGHFRHVTREGRDRTEFVRQVLGMFRLARAAP
jgi:AcrR family transcriptional regulator